MICLRGRSQNKSCRVFAKSIWDNGWPFRSIVKVELVFSDHAGHMLHSFPPFTAVFYF